MREARSFYSIPEIIKKLSEGIRWRLQEAAAIPADFPKTQRLFQRLFTSCSQCFLRGLSIHVPLPNASLFQPKKFKSQGHF